MAAISRRHSMPEVPRRSGALAAAVPRRGSTGALPRRALAPAPERRLSSSSVTGSVSHLQRITVLDITAILSVSIRVEGFQYDSSIMEHPEFLLHTVVVFQCQQHGSRHVETSWKTYRTFQEFQVLDSQLRQRFPVEMCAIPPPAPHRRRTFFRLHRTRSFLSRRCRELGEYLNLLLHDAPMRLTRFLDPRAPLVLRCFCNFDASFGQRVELRANQYEHCDVCLDALADLDVVPRDSIEVSSSLELVVRADSEIERQQDELKQQREWRRQTRERKPPRDETDRLNELEANLMDDRARNIAMCSRFECTCRRASFHATQTQMSRILTFHGHRQRYHPGEDGPTALYCVLFRLQQLNDLDRKLHDLISQYSGSGVQTDSYSSQEEDFYFYEGCEGGDAQLAAGVSLLREALSRYGLMHVYRVRDAFQTTVVDLKKKLHRFKSGAHHRVGTVELSLLSTMLDLHITVLTNDHQGTIHDILPLPGLPSIRSGGRVSVTLGYSLPTVFNVNGTYVLAERVAPPSSGPTSGGRDPTLWRGLDEMERQLMALIEAEVKTDMAYLAPFDHDEAEAVNRALLEVIWNDCEQNPKLFTLFRRMAQQFGRGQTSARVFCLYLEVAFGVDGAAYLEDMLLHVLPEESLRKKLWRMRWLRVHRLLAKRLTIGAAA
ncbi:hypothetical protein P43SY_008963 [Pythium insidiosum]|uniref:PX domain-containing protein n=1 Tax=Pythium insidiosum TaxID=114742 RepID=A0AAD5MAE8_PYTIN|nr:hypothetical protein P43SY_008963 [Pythium insidiosum]